MLRNKSLRDKNPGPVLCLTYAKEGCAVSDTIGKRIKKLRLSRNMTQDDLAGQLHVTRQAVSNWEMGKTAVGVDYLMQLAELFGVTTDELLYGEKAQTGQKYPGKQRRYVITAAVCGVIVLAAVVLGQTVKPIVLERAQMTYRFFPYIFYFYLVDIPAAAAAGGLIPALLAQRQDIRLYGLHRRLALAAGICCLAFWLVFCVGSVFGFVPPAVVNLVTRSAFLMSHANYVFPFLFGVGMFLGLNR